MQNISRILNDIQIFITTNSEQILISVVIFILTWVIFKIIKGVVYNQLRRFDRVELVDAMADSIEGISVILPIVTALYLSILVSLPDATFLVDGTYVFFSIVWFWQIIRFFGRVIDYAVIKYAKVDKDKDITGVKYLSRLIKASLWFFAILIIMSSVGYDISSLIAGLGVSGIAVALAVQALLGDVISSVSILSDKPFTVGDFIIIDGLMGNVEKIGIRSTRVRSISGELIVVPNSKLIQSNIRNYGKIEKRRSLHTVGVTYQTDRTLIKDIPALINTILQGTDLVEKETYRTHLIELGNSALLFEVQFYVLSEDYNEYLSVQQKVLVQIIEQFANEKIEFAYPTQTVFVAQ